MAEPEQNIVICMPSRLSLTSIPLSTVGRCSRCDGEVVVSPSTRAAEKKLGPLNLVCVMCIDYDEVRLGKIATIPGQAQELKDSVDYDDRN